MKYSDEPIDTKIIKDSHSSPEELTLNSAESFIDFSKVESKEIIPGYFAKTIHGEHMTVVYWDVKAVSILPEHSHIHEQVSNFIEGEFELIINGETKILQSGDLAIIKPQSIHSGKAITDCKIIDVFYPKREDY